MKEHIYICIDLKSFYASVECAERGLDSMTAKLVVADMSRTEKTIYLAVSPAMKALGVHNRCRIFEIPSNIEYIAAVPRMQLYIDYAAAIYGIYLKYISKDDIHVYSIDEAFMDVTDYLTMYQLKCGEMASVVYFCNGECIKISGMVARIDETSRILQIVHTKIAFDDILDIDQI